MKFCNICKEEKPKSQFHKDKTKKDGHRSKCKDCYRTYLKNWRKRNPEKVKEYQDNQKALYSQKYKAMYQTYHKTYLQKHPERRKLQQQRYLDENPEAHKAHSQAEYRFRSDPRTKICADCKSSECVEKAHHDYSKPLEVIPLCSKHHKKFDQNPNYRKSMMKFVVLPISEN